MVQHLFDAATSSIVGDGGATLFWVDYWPPDGRIRDLAPHLFALVPTHAARSRTVRDGLPGGWLEDITPDLDAHELSELLVVADRLVRVELQVGVEDAFRWNWASGGVYSASSCYKAFFAGDINMVGAL